MTRTLTRWSICCRNEIVVLSIINQADSDQMVSSSARPCVTRGAMGLALCRLREKSRNESSSMRTNAKKLLTSLRQLAMDMLRRDPDVWVEVTRQNRGVAKLFLQKAVVPDRNLEAGPADCIQRR